VRQVLPLDAAVDELPLMDAFPRAGITVLRP
jgi:hypothetical protein